MTNLDWSIVSQRRNFEKATKQDLDFGLRIYFNARKI